MYKALKLQNIIFFTYTLPKMLSCIFLQVCLVTSTYIDELASCENNLKSLKSEKESSESELSKLKTEISDIKTATAIAEAGREDEMSSLRRKYNEEVASMQHLIKGWCDVLIIFIQM